MIRLAEYFVVVGYDFDKSKHNESDGKIIQRFPSKDWPDYKYEVQVEMFCQPCGWILSDVKRPPTFFVAYLTNTLGEIYYLACLSFHEAISASLLDNGKQTNASSAHSSYSRKLQHSNSSSHSRNLSTSSAIQLNNSSNKMNGTESPSIHEINGTVMVIDHENEGFIEDPNLVKPDDKYAPKSLILLARHGHFDVLKNCLSIIYSIYMDPHREISLEYIIGNILSAVDAPSIGGSRISFTIGAGDKQVIQPSVCPTLPVTRSSVSMLFKHLGMQNVLAIFSSLINDQKILLYSQSLNRLTEACHALRSLLYPLKYGNVFIPIIPKTIIDVLSTPTPFLAGVHTSYRPMYDLMDVVMVDLDGGSAKYPDSIPLVPLCEPHNSITIDSLTKILNPDLLTADEVYPPFPSPPPDPIWQDKQLRAVFIRLFCRLFAGYRSCLALTRIRVKPVIHFNESMFLLLRGLRNDSDEFIYRLLSCMSFGQFIQDRGTPYRVCDVFDEEYESMTELLRSKSDSFDDLQTIDKLAKKLYDNENRGSPVIHQLPQEAKLAHTRIHTQQFQLLDESLISDHIKTNTRNKSRREKQNQADLYDSTSLNKLETAEPRFVPHGLELDKQIFKTEALSDKNKVIREFVANIFNNHITEALKRRNTIRQDLKNRLIRRIFIDELYRQLYPDQSDTFGGQYDLNIAPYNSEISCERKALLGYQQFELVNDLMGEALRQEGQNEESGVVPIIMELSTKFCTQLNNIRYYSNMTHQIQEHPVWECQKFWITAFCDQVNNEIRQLYLHHSESQYRQRSERQNLAEKHSANLHTSGGDRKRQLIDVRKSWSHNAGVSSQPSLAPVKSRLSVGNTSPTKISSESKRILYTNKMSALDMAAEEMKIIDIPDPEVQTQEEATVYAQILHFINLIVNFRIPLNIVDKNEQRSHSNHLQHQQIHNYPSDYGDGISMATSVSGGNYDSESGYEDAGYLNTRITNLETWLRKFVDKTASENNLTQANIENIKSKIEGIIEGHISNLEAIFPEVQNIPKVKKVEVTSPVLLPNEKVIIINNKESLRCHLLLDGRHEKLDMQRQREQDFEGLGGQTIIQGNPHKSVDEEDDFDALRPLLPAQGALFITNYRVVFHGAPKDPYQSNKLVCRSFPIAALKSIKKLGMKPFVFGVSNSQGVSFNLMSNRQNKARGGEGGCLDVIRIRSNTFQMLKIGLEQEDSSPEIKEELSIKLIALRYPPMLSFSFNTSNKIGTTHQKMNYCTGLPDEIAETHKRCPSESISSLYSSSHNYSFSTTSPSIHSNLKQKNTFTRNTLRLAKEGINKISKIKGRTSPSSTGKSKGISESESERSSAIHDDETRDFVLDLNYAATDAKLLEKLRSTLGYSEYSRLNLGSFPAMFNMNDRSGNRNELVKLIYNFNDRYQNVKSYQSMMVVPQVFNEASLKKIAKTHRKNRFPIITWKSAKTKAYLLRGAGFQAKGIMGKLLKQTSSQGNTTNTSSMMFRNVTTTLQKQPDAEITAAKEQIRYFQAIVDISPSFEEIQNHLSSLDPLVHWNDNCRQNVMHHKKNPLEKAYKSVMAGGEKARTLLKNEVFKMSSSHDDLNKRLDNVFHIHNTEFDGCDRDLKYADEDDVLSQTSTSTIGLGTEKKPNKSQIKENRGYRRKGVRQIIQAKLQTTSLFRSNSPSSFRIVETSQSRSHGHNKNLNYPDEFTRSTSFNLRTGFISSFRGNAAGFTPLHNLSYPTNRRSSKESLTSAVPIVDELIDDEEGTMVTTNVLNQSGDPGAHLGELKIVPLYILGEKSQMKTMSKSDSFHDIEFIAVENTNKQQIKEAYELLLKATLPDNVSSVPIISHLNPSGSSNRFQETQPGSEMSLAVAANKWILQIQCLLELSGTVVDLIDIQSASVAVCLEDGWDVTSQIVSLAQIMLDPNYRTISGFWALIEKDWLMAGHKFYSRLYMSSNSKSGNFIPVFLQFLDAVHQLLNQFPMAFEFNDFYLKFFAYHHLSNRFHNFKMDCEGERIQWMRSLDEDCTPGSRSYEQNSIWNYIQHHHEEWPIFFNFLYNPRLSQEVLRPCTNLSMIDIWEYYLNEDLSSGSVYDLDHFCPSYRKRNTLHYDPILNGAFNNSHVESVYAILGLREGCEVRNWQKIWNESCEDSKEDLCKLESVFLNTDDEDYDADATLKSYSTPSKRSNRVANNCLISNAKHHKEEIQNIRTIAYNDHKNTSLQRLEKRHLENPQENAVVHSISDTNYQNLNSDHNLQKLPTHLEFQTICEICRTALIGTIMLKCSRCNLACHDKCICDFPNECKANLDRSPKESSPNISEFTDLSPDNQPITPDTVSPTSVLSHQTIQSAGYKINDSSTDKIFDVDRRKKSDDLIQASETTFSGDLYKLSQHTLFPSWQKKYFTLDIIRHELRYSDSKDVRSNSKHILLQDITGVRILTTLQNHQKRFPESAFLELQTDERTYKLASEHPSVINEWMEKIQNSIQ